MDLGEASDFVKALSVNQRGVKWSDRPSALLKGLSKWKDWKKLDAFTSDAKLFDKKLAREKLTFFGWLVAAGSDDPHPLNPDHLDWLRRANERENIPDYQISELCLAMPAFSLLLKDGLVAPFRNQLAGVFSSSNLSTMELNLALGAQSETIEQISRRTVILELNIASIRNELNGNCPEDRFSDFLTKFDEKERRWEFLEKYPVLTKIFTQRLEDWILATEEFYSRLGADRALLQRELNLEQSDELRALRCGGDKHNHGRAVTVVEFDSGKKIVYKPRSVSLEAGFQRYLRFFNSVQMNVQLRALKVIDRKDYGWVEFVEHKEATSDAAALEFHKKLGFVLGLVYSLDGVDVFFENLVASDADPVVIDLESMFHTFIDVDTGSNPIDSNQKHLRESVTGIGILPRPAAGSAEDELFDISVLGAAAQQKAPYQVPGIINRGRDDMRMTSIPGWIEETHATTNSNIDKHLLSREVLEGLRTSLFLIMGHKEEICAPNGVLDTCFKGAERRLIVRDTTVYGSLLLDETHPQMMKDQTERALFHDNLWRDLLTRPSLALFVESELSQIDRGDVPYFSGCVTKTHVVGSDGTRVDLSPIARNPPLEVARSGIERLTVSLVNEQIRLAACSLSLIRDGGPQLPKLPNENGSTPLIAAIANHLCAAAKQTPNAMWLNTTTNPIPLARETQAVSLQPMNPFLYEGVSGVAMFLFHAGLQLKEREITEVSEVLLKNCFKEVSASKNASASGFTGLASLVYVVNHCRVFKPCFGPSDRHLRALVESIEKKIARETSTDLLTGLSGTALALIPFVTRTKNKSGLKALKICSMRLTSSAKNILEDKGGLGGLSYSRGFSHGISGLAYALYRLAEFFHSGEMLELAEKLLLIEYGLVVRGGWTDEHKVNGNDLSAWCHGAPGIALGLSAMKDIVNGNQELALYLESAIEETFGSDLGRSQCLCHGSVGNAMIMNRVAADRFQKSNVDFHRDLIEKLADQGFESLDAAQTLSCSLMTGITGIGAYLLDQNNGFNLTDLLTLR